jgi:8-oxo-dGTP diphosphatase
VTGSPQTVGDREAGVVYRLRPSAYAIVFDSSNRVGLVWTGRLYFLPGGGADPGEAPEDTVIRETLEETGHEITIVRRLPDVVELFRSREDGLHYEVCGAYFLGEIGDRIADPTEPHHELRWFPPDEALAALHRPGHIHATREAIRSSD